MPRRRDPISTGWHAHLLIHPLALCTAAIVVKLEKKYKGVKVKLISSNTNKHVNYIQNMENIII